MMCNKIEVPVIVQILRSEIANIYMGSVALVLRRDIKIHH